jgi:asparagine synthase (glutamine-hydrolysing)
MPRWWRCDLSGLDSTSLCSLAVRSARRVVAATGASPDVMHDDVEWARLSAGELGIDHDVLPWEDTPLTYDGILNADDRFDEPCIMLANRARILRLADHTTANGARIRLAGIGGDEMLDTAPVWLHSLARSNPLAAWRIARGYRQVPLALAPSHHGTGRRAVLPPLIALGGSAHEY